MIENGALAWGDESRSLAWGDETGPLAWRTESGAPAWDDGSLLLDMGGASVDAGSITFDSGGTIMTDSGGLLVLDSCAEFNYGGILVDGGGTLDLHGCALSIGTLILCDGVLDLNGGQPSPDARKAEGVRPVARYKFDAEGNIVPVRKRRRRHRRPSEGVDDSPGDAQ